MYIATIPNRGSPPAILLREGYREDGKVKTRTIANLSRLPSHAIEALRRSLKGEPSFAPETNFERVDSWHHGHVDAVLGAMKRLRFESLLSSRRSRERDLVVAMVVGRIIEPDANKNSKLANTRWWDITTLPQMLDLGDNTDEGDLYAAMDWLLDRQERIEKKLATRHLKDRGQVLYDLSSSYFEGTHCPLAALGHNRDGKKGKLQVNYGVITDEVGRPIAISVFPGNTADGKTLMPQVKALKERFGIGSMTLVGDRGMISGRLIDETLRDEAGVDWITALKFSTIRTLVDNQHLQLGLFDDKNLFELSHPDYPDERLVACRNNELAKLRARKRRALLEATSKELDKIRSSVQRAKLQRDKAASSKTKRPTQRRKREILGKDNIGVRVGKVVSKYKVAKHFVLDIGDDMFDFRIDESAVASEAALDGLYVIRTSVPSDRLSAAATVRSYKNLSRVERAFRSLKTIDLKIRPIRHWTERRVRAHILLCMLAYYVQWHMLEAWRPLLFADEDQEAKTTRDPVAPAARSDAALQKVHSKLLDDATEAHSYQTLLRLLSQIVRNRCRLAGARADTDAYFEFVTTPYVKQQQAFDLLRSIAA
jgi:transposase